MDASLVAVILGGVAGAAFGAMRFVTGYTARRTRRVLRRARVVPIAKLVDGQLACIVGTVEVDGEPIESLITRRACVAFDTVTFVNDVNDLTTTVRTTRRVAPFFVVDAAGDRVRIDAPEVALCNKPVAKADNYEERILEDRARIRIVGSVSLEVTERDANERLFRHTAFKARLTGTAKYPLLADVEKS
ncbi:MAG: hypothetical protein ABI867_36670 [Kofleriaceae bacterium]